MGDALQNLIDIAEQSESTPKAVFDEQTRREIAAELNEKTKQLNEEHYQDILAKRERVSQIHRQNLRRVLEWNETQ